jgi:hypothetical protein
MGGPPPQHRRWDTRLEPNGVTTMRIVPDPPGTALIAQEGLDDMTSPAEAAPHPPNTGAAE